MKRAFYSLFNSLLFVGPAILNAQQETVPPGTESTGENIVSALKDSTPDVEWSVTVSKVFWAIVTIAVTLFVLHNLSRVLEAVSEKWANLRITIKGIIPILRISGWTASIFFIITKIFAPPIETLLAFTASAGIAIGFAAQDILKNIFGGIMILLDRPFQVGDKIDVGGHYGEVQRIGLRTVRIVTPDDSLVSIPNGEIVNQSVSNANAGESNCQVVAEFFLPPDVDTQRARKIALRAAAVSRYAYLNKPIVVIFKNEISQGRSVLKMRLKAYVLDIRFEFPFMSEMTETVMREFISKGIVSKEDMGYFKSIHEATVNG